MIQTFRELYNSGKEKLQENQKEDADFEALQLLIGAADFKQADFFLNAGETVPQNICDRYEEMLSQRISGRPLQYILGEWDFYKSTFFVGEGVLIPRPETEQLVEICVKEIRKNSYKTVYDLCAGSGCIGISIAKECPDVQVVMFELFDNALKYTQKNLEAHKLKNAKLVKFDVLNDDVSLLQNVDLLVSNPPYIPCEEIKSLQAEVLREPHTALDGGEDGLVFYSAFEKKWLDKVNQNGFVAMECGEEQSDIISRMFSDKLCTEQICDVFGVSRFVTGRKK